MNPPGRLLYNNYIFDWKVLPNYQFWLEGKVKDEKN